MKYEVINYADVGHEILRREAGSRDEAYEKARETPHATVDTRDANGWVLRTQVFSPKHPVPAT